MLKIPIKGVTCVAGAFILHFTLGSIYTFGNMSPYMSSYMRKFSDSKWVTNADLIWIFGSSIGIQGFTTTLGGILAKKFGSRIACLIGCWMMSISIMLTYFTIQQNLYLVILTYGAIAGLGTGFSYTVAIAEAISWFPKNRGLIIGIVVGGFGLGSLVFNQIQTAFINPTNISPNITFGDDKYFDDENMLQRVPFCFLLVGSIYAALQLLGCLFLFKYSVIKYEALQTDVDFSKSKLLEEDRNLMKPLLHTKIKNILPKQILIERDFWILWLTFALTDIMNVFVTSLYKTFGQLFIENDFYLSIVGSVASIFNASGRIFWGQIMDRFSYKISMRTLTVVVVIFSSTFGLLEYIPSKGWAQALHMIWSCVMMGSICGIFAIVPSASVKIFGNDNVAVTYGLLFSATGVAGLCGALSTTILLSKLNYIGIFEFGAALCLVSFSLTFFHKKKDV